MSDAVHDPDLRDSDGIATDMASVAAAERPVIASWTE